MRFSRLPPPPGQPFGRKPDDAAGHDPARPSPAPLPRAEPARWGPPPAAHLEQRKPSPAAPAASRGEAGGDDAGGAWQSVAAPASGRSLIDELAAEAESADDAPARPAWPEETGSDDRERCAPDRRPAGAAEDDDLEALRTDDLDDMSVTIGRVVSIRGSVVWGALFDDDDGTAARAARMGALVSMRGPDSRVFGIVNALKRDGAGGSSQAERTIFEIQVLGEISTVSPGARAAGFQRGVSSYPPLDAPVTTVTLRDLAAV